VLELIFGMALALFGSWIFIVVAKKSPTFEIEQGTGTSAIPIALLFRAIAGPCLLASGLMRGRLGGGNPVLVAGWAVAAIAWAHTSGALILAIA
jgi:hypothetical protein